MPLLTLGFVDPFHCCERMTTHSRYEEIIGGILWTVLNESTMPATKLKRRKIFAMFFTSFPAESVYGGPDGFFRFAMHLFLRGVILIRSGTEARRFFIRFVMDLPLILS